MEGRLKKIGNEYKLYAQDDSCIATSWYAPYQRLSKNNCQAIENGYDLDELAEQNWRIGLEEYIPTPATHVTSFKAGFQKALEILGDKKFSEEHLKVAADWYYETKGKKSIDEYIQSLQKTEWDVIVEMECPQCKEWGYISECRNNCNQKFLQPKLDADGCLILKRK